MSGHKSWPNASDQTKLMSLNVLASNRVTEVNHASFTVGLKRSCIIHLDHVCAEGQTRHNNDFGRGHEFLLGDRGFSQKSIDGELGTYTHLCGEHQRSIIQAVLEMLWPRERGLMMPYCNMQRYGGRGRSWLCRRKLKLIERITSLVCTLMRCIILIGVGKLRVMHKHNLECWVVGLQDYKQ
jgi:hypothetical protein